MPAKKKSSTRTAVQRQLDSLRSRTDEMYTSVDAFMAEVRRETRTQHERLALFERTVQNELSTIKLQLDRMHDIVAAAVADGIREGRK